MNAADVIRIRNHPAFQELERKRNSFCWTLFIVMVLIYGSFIFLVAFDPSIVAQQLGNGPFTLAFPLGLGVIVAAIALTAIYVVRANSEFDRLTLEVVGQADRISAAVNASYASAAR